MSKEQNILVPTLRFPAFKDAKGWKEKPLGKASEILRGGSPRPIDAYLTDDKNALNWLKIGDIDKDSKYVSHTSGKVKPEALSKTREVHPNDLIMSNSMSFGRPYIMNIRSCIHDGWLAITEIDDEIDRDYLYYYILSNSSQSYFLNAAAGGGIKNLNAEIVKKLPLLFPKEKDEQKEIAACLSSLDELITVQDMKVNTLKKHKKGLMQQLFPQEGETLPKQRFPEFKDAGKWEEKSINQICNKPYSGGTPPTSKREYYGGTIPFIRSAEIDKDKTELFLTEFGVQNSSAKYVKKGDVLIALYGANSGDVALSKIDGVINQAILCLSSTDSNAFLYHYFTFKKEWLINKYIQGGQGNLSGDIIKSIELYFPTPTEQQRIADCLSSINEVITAQAKKAETLKAYKKGLMQQLFPSNKGAL